MKRRLYCKSGLSRFCHFEPPEESGQVVETPIMVLWKVLRQAQDDNAIFIIYPQEN